jgi:serine protease Do
MEGKSITLGWKHFLVLAIVVPAFITGLLLLLYTEYFMPLNQGGNSSAAVEVFHDEHGNEVVRVISQESAVVSAVQKADPAVVSIVVTKDLPIVERRWVDDPLWGQFEQDPMAERLLLPFRRRKIEQRVTDEVITKEIGGGSGFVVTEDGMVVTNKHVLADEEADYMVLFNDGEKHPAQVIAKDPSLDIAVLQIDKEGQDELTFPTLQLGNSSELKVGQSVIAIGNALGEFRNTVSTGIVSGLLRDLVAGSRTAREVINDAIQTDAAINRGNSGGPLLNLNGEVVGINVAVASGAQNISFAIPVDEVKVVLDMVREGGSIERPYIGVRYVPINKAFAQKSGVPVEYGALVMRGADISQLAIIPGSPADKAGLRENDIILMVNEQKITSDQSLSRLLLNHQVGDTVVFRVLRQGEELDLDVELGKKPVN